MFGSYQDRPLSILSLRICFIARNSNKLGSEEFHDSSSNHILHRSRPSCRVIIYLNYDSRFSLTAPLKRMKRAASIRAASVTVSVHYTRRSVTNDTTSTHNREIDQTRLWGISISSRKRLIVKGRVDFSVLGSQNGTNCY